MADRLPAEPLVVTPLQQAGPYGGELHMYMAGVGSHTMTGRTCAYDFLLRWNPEYTKVIPNVAKSVVASDEGRTYTIMLREGMRWSDGELFTSEDVEFGIKDILLNTELYPSPPSWLLPAGELTVEVPDKTTLVLHFTEPNGFLPYYFARNTSQVLTRSPKHFLKDFHHDYADGVEALAKKGGFATWVELFGAKGDDSVTPELPVVSAWKSTSAIKGNRWEFERNAYYWKTDPDGRQLPYIDTFGWAILDNAEVALLKAMQGDIDLSTSGLYINTLKNKPQLAEASEKGKYKLTKLGACNMNVMALSLNLSHRDARLRELFNLKDFRIGLSHAINRPELIKLAFQEQGEPWQMAPRSDSEFYDEEFAKQYSEFDVDKANSFLDRAGLKRDSKGARLYKGKAVSFTVDCASFQPYFVDLLNSIKAYWAEVGVSIQVNNQDRTLFYQRKNANQFDANVYVGEYGDTFGSLLDPRWYFPFSSESNFGIQWAAWVNSRGKTGMKPPKAAQEQCDLYRKVQQSADKDGQFDLMRQILKVAKEQFWCLGIALPADGYGLVSDRLHNVPDSIPDAYTYLPPGPTNPEQYYLAAQ